jgi:tetratricopeptide (TPR) repeat protein
LAAPKDETARLLEYGRVLYSLKRYPDTEANARKLLARDPKNWKGHYYLSASLLYQYGGKNAEAVSEAHKAIALSPESAECHFLLAWAHLLRHNPRQALKTVRPGLRIAPQDAYGNYLAAWAHKQQCQWLEMLRIAQNGLKSNPEYTRLLNLQAEAVIMLGYTAEAQEAVELALHNDPSDPTAHHNCGLLALFNYRLTEAGAHFREALRLAPNFSYARWGLRRAQNNDYWFYRLLLRIYALSRPLASVALFAGLRALLLMFLVWLSPAGRR